ncbi:ABC transporter ATP-binding protein [Geodermatophilus obscurus]|uniref:ABC transporter ATP-binding protein n=1 Tax=Geodermatophilus obscurus TaxID=1861 RepID=UPI0009F9F446|nr:ABC transporter ATP-binding protein [Geodermatophilus obscurus]
MAPSAGSSAAAAPAARPEGAPVLQVAGLTCAIGGAVIVSDVSFDVAPGEFVAVIGPNGAGKTSLFNLLSGLLPVTSGSVTLAGTDITRAGPADRARRGLGRTFQASSVFAGLTVQENVRLAAQARLGGSMRAWQLVRPSDRAYEVAGRALDRVGLGSRAHLPAGSLSHGDKRKLELAILLATDPALVLLDEPMAGVSTEEVAGLTEVIAGVHREEGKTVLMVEHHMDVLLGLADRVAVMHHGALLALDTPARVTGDPAVQEAYLGDAL